MSVHLSLGLLAPPKHPRCPYHGPMVLVEADCGYKGWGGNSYKTKRQIWRCKRWKPGGAGCNRVEAGFSASEFTASDRSHDMKSWGHYAEGE